MPFAIMFVGALVRISADGRRWKDVGIALAVTGLIIVLVYACVVGAFIAFFRDSGTINWGLALAKDEDVVFGSEGGH